MPAFPAAFPIVNPPSPSATSMSSHIDSSSLGHWFSVHGSLLISHGAQILTIIVACVVIRVATTRAINRVVRHATRAAQGAGRLLGGTGLIAGERTRQRTQAIGSVLRSLASAIIFVIGGLMIVSVLTIPIAPILASVSVVGVALGLGAQGLITDFISGIFMVFEDQYGVGDVIDAGAAKGTVEEVGLRITKLRDADGVMWYVRNGSINRVGNKSQGWSRVVVDVPVAYTEDVGRAREIMALTADELFSDEAWRDRFTDDKPKVVGVESLDGAYVVIRIQARTAPQKDFEVARELRARLKAALDAAEVQVASLK
ncbi:mechanosensitive ion channel family protein [Actinocrinis puniceicyclus]|uniref:Mechanosensitive ion channel family protein n=1 Tax=Actinocrinis puniceicyclus TaxID=977794 RepID=A0A8J7WLA9_9ACTN|nr:mechanosensitive ion channel family protein [Actinocrinis puniceicyclus]MBS2961874.1 mechanosensitive ion channel family protein [Actinocrinis puniceicyclus]